MDLGMGGATVRVEPKKTQSGVKWYVRKNGVTQGRAFNYKDDAIKKGRKVARKANGTLKILNTDMNVSDTVSYS